MNLFAFFLTTIAGLSTLVGSLLIFIFPKKSNNIIITALAFAAGVMSFLSIIDLIPEGYYLLNTSLINIISILFCMIFLVIGIIISMVIDQLFPGHKIIIKDTNSKVLFKIGIISMIAIIIHNIPEGIATYITTTTNIKLGISLTIAIALHNIPEGISISLPIYYATGNKKKAILYTFISGLSEPFGAFIAYIFLAPIMTNNLLGIIYSLIAGIMLHISLTELLPTSLSYKKRKLTIIFFIIGMLFVTLSHILF